MRFKETLLSTSRLNKKLIVLFCDLLSICVAILFALVISDVQIASLGINEYLESSNYCLIEWPDLLIDLIEEKYILTNIYRNNEIERDIEIIIN